MDPKRKRIYIIVIVGCIIIIAGILLWNRISAPTSVPASPELPSNTTAPIQSQTAPVRNLDATYPAPAVFPANKTLDTEVLNSSAFTSLQTYVPLQINPGDLGRVNPFINY